MRTKCLPGKSSWKNSLAVKQLTYILIFSSIITLFGTVIQLFLEYRKDVGFVKNQIEQIEEVHLKSIAGSLWNFDEGQLQIQLDSLLSLRDIEYIKISDNSGFVYSAGQPGESKNTVTREFSIACSG